MEYLLALVYQNEHLLSPPSTYMYIHSSVVLILSDWWLPSNTSCRAREQKKDSGGQKGEREGGKRRGERGKWEEGKGGGEEGREGKREGKGKRKGMVRKEEEEGRGGGREGGGRERREEGVRKVGDEGEVGERGH